MTVEIRVGRIVRAVVMVVVVPGKLSLDIGLSNAISVTMFCLVWFGLVRFVDYVNVYLLVGFLYINLGESDRKSHPMESRNMNGKLTRRLDDDQPVILFAVYVLIPNYFY